MARLAQTSYRDAGRWHYPAPWSGVAWQPAPSFGQQVLTAGLRLVRDALWVCVVGAVVTSALGVLTSAGL